MRFPRILLIIISFASVSILVFSQDTDRCTTVMEQAITVADEQCSGLGRNKICYGNDQIFVEAQNQDTEIALKPSVIKP